MFGKRSVQSSLQNHSFFSFRLSSFTCRRRREVQLDLGYSAACHPRDSRPTGRSFLFGPSALFPAWPIHCPAIRQSEWLTSLADVITYYASADFCLGRLSTTSVAVATQSGSPQPSSMRSHRICTFRIFDGYGFRGKLPRWSDADALYPVLVHRLALLLHASFRPHRASVTLAFSLALHLHQVGQRTFTSKPLSIPSTQRSRWRGGCPTIRRC